MDSRDVEIRLYRRAGNEQGNRASLRVPGNRPGSPGFGELANGDGYLREDKYHLGLQRFFQSENPHAGQMLLVRLLEVDRQRIHEFSPKDRALLAREYVPNHRPGWRGLQRTGLRECHASRVSGLQAARIGVRPGRRKSRPSLPLLLGIEAFRAGSTREASSGRPSDFAQSSVLQ
jgi:hypothetical protein